LLSIPGDAFLIHDLTKPLRLNSRFDLALCLEVAEHLPRSAAEILVNSLVDAAPAVAFSAAIPFQCGSHHVNEQWQTYWAALFKSHHYDVFDCVRPLIWTNPRVDPWYAQNLLLFAERDSDAHRRLNDVPKPTLPIDVVHPRHYLSWADPRKTTARKSLISILGIPFGIINTLHRKASLLLDMLHPPA
jgi:hypothetical protein